MRLCRAMPNNPPDIAWQSSSPDQRGYLPRYICHPKVVTIGIGFPGFIGILPAAALQVAKTARIGNVDLAGDLTRVVRKRIGRE